MWRLAHEGDTSQDNREWATAEVRGLGSCTPTTCLDLIASPGGAFASPKTQGHVPCNSRSFE